MAGKLVFIKVALKKSVRIHYQWSKVWHTPCNSFDHISSLQIDPEDIRYLSEIYVIMQEIKTQSVTANMDFFHLEKLTLVCF